MEATRQHRILIFILKVNVEKLKFYIFFPTCCFEGRPKVGRGVDITLRNSTTHLHSKCIFLLLQKKRELPVQW